MTENDKTKIQTVAPSAPSTDSKTDTDLTNANLEDPNPPADSGAQANDEEKENQEDSQSPNIAFVGKDGSKDKLYVETSFQNGMQKKIKMPSVEEQLEGPFFHERANEIVRISPYYKAVKPKGK